MLGCIKIESGKTSQKGRKKFNKAVKGAAVFIQQNFDMTYQTTKSPQIQCTILQMPNTLSLIK